MIVKSYYVECYNEGINFQPIVPLFTNRATCHRNWGMFSEAYFDYSFAIRMEPENGALYCLRGVVLAKLKKIAMANEDLDLGCKVVSVFANFDCVNLEFGFYCRWNRQHRTCSAGRQYSQTLGIMRPL